MEQKIDLINQQKLQTQFNEELCDLLIAYNAAGLEEDRAMDVIAKCLNPWIEKKAEQIE